MDAGPAPTLREYFDARLADSDKRLDERLDALEKLRDMDRDFFLTHMRDLMQWREEATRELASIRDRITTVGAGITLVVTVVIAAIQIWRGSP